MVIDVAIAGGGPAGAALAVELGNRGVRVALYEQAQQPRLKACGEGLLPHGVVALSRIAGLPDAPRVRGLRFVSGRDAVEVDFPEGFGLIVRRDRFGRWLLDRAGATANVDLRVGRRYAPDGERVVVGADGRLSTFHRRLRAYPPSRVRVGLSAHLTGLSDLGDQVEVFFHRDGELYLAPTGGGEALVAGLFDVERFRRDGLLHLLQTVPELRDRAAHVEFTTPVLGAKPLGLRVPRVVAPGLLLIGDAAGAPDPITGDGMALAFTSVYPAADAIVSGDFLRYQQARLAMARTTDRLSRLLLRAARADGRVARGLLKRPGFATTLLDVALGRRPLTPLTLLRTFR